jgi:hypothetical protein
VILYVNGVMEGMLSNYDPVDLPCKIEYIGGEVYNCLFITKSLSR